jgi:hypothetical protein
MLKHLNSKSQIEEMMLTLHKQIYELINEEMKIRHENLLQDLEKEAKGQFKLPVTMQIEDLK